MPDKNNSSLTFSPNYSRWPFVSIADTMEESEWYQTRISPDLRKRINEWNESFLSNYDQETGNFPSQRERAEFDRTYISLANELKHAGLEFSIDLWW